MTIQRSVMIAIILIAAIVIQFWPLKLSKNTGCLDNPKQQIAASQELSQLFQQDIHDRDNWQKMNQSQLAQMKARDRKRRMRVATLFADGCFKSAKDYAHAALIFQHGNTPDHYYQTFIWSKRAVLLGDEEQKQMMALSIDRYLISIGQKQLFGSQSFASDATHGCFCMQSVERSFPDALRQQYLGESLDEKYQQVAAYNQGNPQCKHLDCSDSLKPSPAGTFPGIW